MRKIAHNQFFANIVLIISLLCSIYWIGIFLIKDVYAWVLVGAVYEILWLPNLAVIYLLPVFILILDLSLYLRSSIDLKSTVNITSD